MHPQIVSDRPGSCPICQMKLVPDLGDESGDASTDAAPGDAASLPGETAPVPGFAPVRIPEGKRRLIGARTTEAAVVPFVRTIRATGQVSLDETRIHHVHTKVPGWIEHFTAGAAGDPVRAGQPLLTIYSPELLATQKEYLLALENRRRLEAATEDVRRGADELVESARRRMRLWDLSAGQIDRLGSSGEAVRTVTLYSPVSGTILARNVSHGERIDSVTSLLDIADLERVWVIAQVYEHDLEAIHEGQTARITLSYLPGRAFEGRIGLVSPVVSDRTRTASLRIVLDNPGLALKPGMYADVALESDSGPRLGLPDEAILRTGERAVVFVDAGDGLFEPREVDTGLRLEDKTEITRGLRAGERVLSAANFFVDAESRLRANRQAATAP
jgi:Cu(I)/Ag(I) efflux system membrane fusion protein